MLMMKSTSAMISDTRGGLMNVLLLIAMLQLEY